MDSIKQIRLFFLLEHKELEKNGIPIDGMNLAKAMKNLKKLGNLRILQPKDSADTSNIRKLLFLILSNLKISLSIRKGRVMDDFEDSKFKDLVVYQQIPLLIFSKFKNHRTKVIFRIHDFFPTQFTNLYSIKEKILFRIRLRNINKADLYLCNSKATQEELLVRCKVPQKALVVPCLTPSFAYRVEGFKAPCACNVNLDRKYVLSVSSMVPRKNVIMLIDYWYKYISHLGIDLVLIGESTNLKYSKQVNQKIMNLPTLTNLGQIQGPFALCEWCVQSSYLDALGYLSFSEAEGYNMPVHDALFFGLPTLLKSSSSWSKTSTFLKYERVEELIYYLDSFNKNNLEFEERILHPQPRPLAKTIPSKIKENILIFEELIDRSLRSIIEE